MKIGTNKYPKPKSPQKNGKEIHKPYLSIIQDLQVCRRKHGLWDIKGWYNGQSLDSMHRAIIQACSFVSQPLVLVLDASGWKSLWRLYKLNLHTADTKIFHVWCCWPICFIQRFLYPNWADKADQNGNKENECKGSVYRIKFSTYQDDKTLEKCKKQTFSIKVRF